MRVAEEGIRRDSVGHCFALRADLFSSCFSLAKISPFFERIPHAKKLPVSLVNDSENSTKFLSRKRERRFAPAPCRERRSTLSTAYLRAEMFPRYDFYSCSSFPLNTFTCIRRKEKIFAVWCAHGWTSSFLWEKCS